ncbi:unnamed protein product [Aphanomyces euteiches]
MWVYAILAILILLLIALIVYLAFVVPLRNPPQPDPAVTIIPELVPTDVFREHLSDRCVLPTLNSNSRLG